MVVFSRFEDDLIIVLDGAPYFQASAVTDLAACNDFTFVRFPTYSPELNPVEECWKQLQSALSNRFFDYFLNSQQRLIPLLINSRFQGERLLLMTTIKQLGSGRTEESESLTATFYVLIEFADQELFKLVPSMID